MGKRDKANVVIIALYPTYLENISQFTVKAKKNFCDILIFASKELFWIRKCTRSSEG